jgi:hypothetical protein
VHSGCNTLSPRAPCLPAARWGCAAVAQPRDPRVRPWLCELAARAWERWEGQHRGRGRGCRGCSLQHHELCYSSWVVHHGCGQCAGQRDGRPGQRADSCTESQARVVHERGRQGGAAAGVRGGQRAAGTPVGPCSMQGHVWSCVWRVVHVGLHRATQQAGVCGAPPLTGVVCVCARRATRSAPARARARWGRQQALPPSRLLRPPSWRRWARGHAMGGPRMAQTRPQHTAHAGA